MCTFALYVKNYVNNIFDVCICHIVIISAAPNGAWLISLLPFPWVSLGFASLYPRLNPHRPYGTISIGNHPCGGGGADVGAEAVGETAVAVELGGAFGGVA